MIPSCESEEKAASVDFSACDIVANDLGSPAGQDNVKARICQNLSQNSDNSSQQ